VHYWTVHTACAIIAGNRSDGWISAGLDGREKIELADDCLLPGEDYWFFVPAPDLRAHPPAQQAQQPPTMPYA